MKWTHVTVLIYVVIALKLVQAEQPTVYEVTISTFNDELRSPYHSLPLYCSISPQPDEPLFYGWKHSVYNQYVSTTATSPYAYYKPLFNHPRYGRVFCHVETEERFLGTGSILLEAQGYVEAIGSTMVSLEPTEPLTLKAEVSRQYSTDNKSPLLNMRVLTRWNYNGGPITQPIESDQLTLSFNRTQESDTGHYVLSVSHFYISRGFNRNNETEGMLGVEGDINRQCSGIVLGTLGLYAIFSPVEFQVSIGTKQIPAEPTESANYMYYKFFEKKQLFVIIQIPLQQIQGIDYRQLSDNFELSYKLLYNGKTIFDTTYRLSSRGYTSRASEYRLINHSTVEANLTFFSPKATDVGTYEYQFYVTTESVQRVLNTTQCDESYRNFLVGGIRLPFFLIGQATIYIEMADRIAVNASKKYYSIGDEEGSTLSCTLAQQNSSALVLSWYKNGYQVATKNSSSILYMNISDIVGQLDFVNEYGTYICTAMETDGRQISKSIHIAEKASFSLQLRPENGLDCASVSTEAVNTAVLSELRYTFSQTCTCDITPDDFTMATMSCDDNNMLTLSSDLLFSDQDGEMTASNLLSSAASRLAGVRTFNDGTLVIDTSCALRDAGGRCIEAQPRQENQLTTLATVLLAMLILAIMVTILTGLIGCVLRRTKQKKEIEESSNVQSPLQMSTQSHRPITSPEISIDPQSYSYPQIHSIAGRRAISFAGRTNHHVLGNTRSNSMGNSNTSQSTQANGTESAQNYTQEAIPSKLESSLNCVPNPAYTVTTSDNERDINLSNNYRSIRHGRRSSPGGATERHIYDYPRFGEVQRESEQEESWEESDYYI